MSIPLKTNESRNPEHLVEAFDNWNNKYQVLAKEKSILVNDLKQERTEKELLLKSNEKLQNEIKMLHKMVDKFHEMVNKLANLEDQYQILKLDMKTKETDIEMLNRKLQDVDCNHKKEQEELKRTLEEDYERMNEKMKTEYEFEKHLMEKQLADKEKYISELQNKITENEKLKESELTKLSMTYENKLVQLQQRKAQTQQNANSEIFRKKLQHMKSEYEQEICLLKQTINTLQSRMLLHTSGNALSTGLKNPSTSAQYK